MAKKPAPVPQQTETEDQVKLKPFMGIRPGVYLAVLYSLILLAILFFLLIFPGLRNPGAVLLVKTEPMGAAVRVNGIYMGTSSEASRSTAGRIFVPKGTHTIEAVLPGFETVSAVHKIPGRVFGSLFFPRKYRIEITLKTSDAAAAFAQAAGEFAAWSFGGEPTAAWQIPLSLSEGAYRIGPYKTSETDEILLAASRFTVTRAALRDLIRAKMLLDNSGNSPSAAAITGSISDILVFLSENTGSAQWLADLLPPESASLIEASDWFKNENSRGHPSFSQFSGNPSLRRQNFAGLIFIELAAGSSGFMMSENPVPRFLFETFVNENPQWKAHYTDYYEEISLSTSEMYSPQVITGATWYAAEAFCLWLTQQLPQSFSGMEVRLPAENEWEYAAEYIRNMRNPGWEWCADPFAPLQFNTVSAQAVQMIGSPERLLRGRPSASAEQMRASLPPELSSPFVTFRPVISEKRHE